jgi:tetratricopeptide (TPR) repeat protein
LFDKKFSLAEVELQAKEERASASSDLVVVNVEIVELNRRLAAMRPAVCLPDLAVSLNNVGWARQSEHSVKAFEEAVEINRRLLDATPSDIYRGALATSLGNLGGALQRLERWEQAAQATQQSIDVHRQLSADSNQNTEMAVLLRLLGQLYEKADRREDAARATGEAVELYRKGVLAKPQADMLKSWLVGALNEWGAQLQSLERTDEALVAAEEAVHNSRSLARTWMGPENLRSSLHRLASILTVFDRDDEAAAATQEANSLPMPKGVV